MRDDQQRLLDIIEAIENINRHSSKGHDIFTEDELVQVWIVHHLQIIGEAAAGLSGTFRDGHSQIPWVDIIALRNVLVHHYFGIDLDEIWDTVTIDLPVLKTNVEALLIDFT